MEVERNNHLNPDKDSELSYVEQCFSDKDIPVIAATDYMRSYSEQIRPYIKSPYHTLGTDGYGSDSPKGQSRQSHSHIQVRTWRPFVSQFAGELCLPSRTQSLSHP